MIKDVCLYSLKPIYHFSVSWNVGCGDNLSPPSVICCIHKINTASLSFKRDLSLKTLLDNVFSSYIQGKGKKSIYV